MIDLVWNFPLLPQQKEIWAKYLTAAVAEYLAMPVELQRPSFRTIEDQLRERAAHFLGFATDRTWVTCGGHHGNLIALFASGLAGTRFAMEGTTYPGFLDQCKLTKTRIDGVAIDEHGVIPDALRSLCLRANSAGNPIRGFFTMPTVQNPIGFVTPRARREAVVAIAREFDLTLIEDDAYGYMEPNAPLNYAALAPERTFYVRGVAKSFAPGGRTGFLIAPKNAHAGVMMAIKNTATGTDIPQNLAILSMCEDGTFANLMQQKIEEGTIRNREARTLLDGMAAPGAAAAWHLWVPLSLDVDMTELEKKINATDVMVTMGHWCATSPEFSHGLRIALGGEVDRATTLEGVSRVANILKERRTTPRVQEL